MSSSAHRRRRHLSISHQRRIQDPSREAHLFQLRIGVMVKFRGVLTPSTRGSGGCFVPVPREAAAKLGLKGMPKIQSVIAGQPYRGSLMPMGDGTYCLGVGKAIREAAGVSFGDTVTIELELDTELRIVTPPAALARLIAKDKKMAAGWEKLSFTNKKEMALSLDGARKPETRERRLAAVIVRLRS